MSNNQQQDQQQKRDRIEDRQHHVFGSFSTKLRLNDIVMFIIMITGGLATIFTYDKRIAILEEKILNDHVTCTSCNSQVQQLNNKLIHLESEVEFLLFDLQRSSSTTN